MPILPLQAPLQQKGFYILDCYRFSLRDYLSDLLKPQNIEQEILNVEVKPSKFCGSLFYGSILKMSRANFKYLWLDLIERTDGCVCFPLVR